MDLAYVATPGVKMADHFSQRLTVLRIIHAAMLLSVLIYIGMLLWLSPDVEEKDPVFLFTFVAACAGLVGVTLLFRKKWIDPLNETPAGSTTPQQLMEWHQGNMFSFAAAEAIALFGFVLRFLGHSWYHAGPFFAASIALFVIFAPRRPASLPQ